jgi:predicted site-specific integrase-resolvase
MSKIEKNNQLSEIMSRTQVIEYFGISKSTLNRWSMLQGKLPPIRINRRVWYKRDDVNKLVESNYNKK